MTPGVVARHRLIAVVSACLIAGSSLVAGSAFAATNQPSAFLVVSSSGSASGVVTVKQPIDVGRPFDAFPATFSGQYVGYLVSSLDGKPLLGRARVRHVGFDDLNESTPLWFAEKNLPPGRYRITVVGTGPISLSIPIMAKRSQHVTITGKAHAFARVVRPDTPEMGPAGAAVGNFGVPVPMGHYELGSLTRFSTGSYNQADFGDECFTTTQTCASEGSVAGDGFIFVGNTGDAGFSGGSDTSPQDIGAGVSAWFDGFSPGLANQQAGFVVLIGATNNG